MKLLEVKTLDWPLLTALLVIWPCRLLALTKPLAVLWLILLAILRRSPCYGLSDKWPADSWSFMTCHTWRGWACWFLNWFWEKKKALRLPYAQTWQRLHLLADFYGQLFTDQKFSGKINLAYIIAFLGHGLKRTSVKLDFVRTSYWFCVYLLRVLYAVDIVLGLGL